MKRFILIKRTRPQDRFVAAIVQEHSILFNKIRIKYRIVNLTNDILLHQRFSSPNAAMKWLEKMGFEYEDMGKEV